MKTVQACPLNCLKSPFCKGFSKAVNVCAGLYQYLRTETWYFPLAMRGALNSSLDGFESSELILTCDKMGFFFLSSALP